ncbi:hypothetical protein [Streptomyces acidiscabies]|uniref:hypothetical protein n=1 Tax=Streptomyces acidiscabies TaxID=42234 RepID=UPI00351AE6C7
MARRLAADGTNLALTHLDNDQAAAELATHITDSSGTAVPLAADLRKRRGRAYPLPPCPRPARSDRHPGQQRRRLPPPAVNGDNAGPLGRGPDHQPDQPLSAFP